MKVNADLMHVEREKDGLSMELSGRKQELEATKQLLESQRAEERKLRKILSEASAERARQKKELERVRSDITGCVSALHGVCVCLIVTRSSVRETSWAPSSLEEMMN